MCIRDRLSPDLSDPWIELAAIYLRQQRYEQSLQAVAQIMTAGESQKVRLQLIAAAALRGLGRYAEDRR